MKLNTITNRYIITEMLAPFSINLLVFTFLFLMTEMIEITDWIVNYNLDLLAVLKIIVFTLPWFLMFIIPMSVMMGILLTFLRMSNDNEIIALKSCGLSVYRLLPPVITFALFGCLLTGYITLHGVPQSKIALEKMAIQLAASHADIGLKERTFNDAFDNVMLYVSRIDAASNRIIVSDQESRSKGLVATDLNLIAIDRIEHPRQVQVKIRLKHKQAESTVFPPDGNRTRILFKKPQVSVTPGQSAVLYSDDTVLGGGVIIEAL